MSQAVLFKIKEGRKEEWLSWCKELSTTLRDEAIETLKEEGVVQELTIAFSINGDDYVLGYMDGEILPANMDQEINQKHKEMKEECLERVRDADVLSNFKVSDLK